MKKHSLLSEKDTRARHIDIQLSHAGWSKNRTVLLEEFKLNKVSVLRENSPCFLDSSDAVKQNQFADYVLLGYDNNPIALVEAKRSSLDELAGKRQASDYADAIKAKFGTRKPA